MKVLTKIKDYVVAVIQCLIIVLKDPAKVQQAIKFLEYILQAIEGNKSKAKKGPKYIFKNIGQAATMFFEDKK